MPRYPSSPILWLDLETTGLDVTHDRIVEVGAVLTNQDLHEVDRYHAVLRWPFAALKEMMAPEVWEMHTANGLIRDCTAATGTLSRVSADLVDFIEAYVDPDETLPLAGSGVGHFDLHFVREWLPRVADRLAYWTIDIGVVRRFLRDIVGLPEPDRENVPHRAMDDVLLHLDEARTYRDLLRESHEIANGREDGKVEHLGGMVDHLSEIAGSLSRIEDAFRTGSLDVQVRR